MAALGQLGDTPPTTLMSFRRCWTKHYTILLRPCAPVRWRRWGSWGTR